MPGAKTRIAMYLHILATPRQFGNFSLGIVQVLVGYKCMDDKLLAQENLVSICD